MTERRARWDEPGLLQLLSLVKILPLDSEKII